MDATTEIPPATPAAEDDISDEELQKAIDEYRRHMRDPNRKPLTGKEIVEQGYAEGLIGSRKDITDGREHARKLRERSNHRDHG